MLNNKVVVDSINDKKVIFNKLSKLLLYQRDEDLKQVGAKSGLAYYQKRIKARETYKKYVDNETEKLKELSGLSETELDELTECINVMNESSYEFFKYYLFTLKYSLLEFEGVELKKVKIKSGVGTEIQVNDIEDLMEKFDYDMIIDLGLKSDSHNYINEDLKKN